jgi:hypothetical protein
VNLVGFSYDTNFCRPRAIEVASALWPQHRGGWLSGSQCSVAYLFAYLIGPTTSWDIGSVTGLEAAPPNARDRPGPRHGRPCFDRERRMWPQDPEPQIQGTMKILAFAFAAALLPACFANVSATTRKGADAPVSCAAPLEGLAVQGPILKTLDGVSNLGVCCDECRIRTNCTAVTINGTVCTLRSMTGVTDSANVTSGVTTCIQPAPAGDPGWGSDYSGYYDVQGCGKCKDYCRWVGDSGPGGDPRSQLTLPSGGYWACVISREYNQAWGTWKYNTSATWTFTKC